ncbi:ABC transporter ATP-binding protein [Virgibacillus halodenitrificans]|uniref:Peptide ABC transporter ATP-binding protein n=1 Tax=Virgibacillus halodenitrificans TaxID=1482 RepID=A0AAC9NMI8_VIRHA|nr:ABC transporter ATP-binding protein [Virgibacillus halodenitrificans]APC49734.1 peptide ABC transporter ATP-binding protein [Virgibacillus halodenitrificans]MCJ0929566.1 ABC transporter ATP-binding protein [Virgibacillus halodenitrificans]MEC2158931.1 ABC transporter ATP-binding protein [Virgibacillus halodenitrificans]MYL57179.1 ATP-binding cassette domain-containing protein [Virgibacillus halodenitrificans]CDQ31534.1 Stage 0 sporulation protein KD [Virgibacillus halodenitrificans]
MEKILDVKDLHVTFTTYGGTVKAVRGVNFHLNKGETLAIVGESGCGKSVTSNAIMRLIPDPPGKISNGSIHFHGKDLVRLTEKQMRNIRGVDISMIFQDPMTALNPTLTIGTQLMEGLRQHKKITGEEAKQKALEMMNLVGIPNPEERLKQYPHQFSGGMRQRIVIAMALICEPELLIADEPTTALDVTIQAQILELFNRIQEATGVSIILITHDLGVVAKIADRIAVMYAGKIIEVGTKREIFYQAQHPYTKGLLKSVPRLDLQGEKLTPIDGTPPDLFSPPVGCPFTARCPFAMEVCDKVYPGTTELSDAHKVDCWLQDERAKQLLASTANN